MSRKQKRVKALEGRLQEIAIRANNLEDRAFDAVRVEQGLEPLLEKGTANMYSVKLEANAIVGLAMSLLP